MKRATSKLLYLPAIALFVCLSFSSMNVIAQSLQLNGTLPAKDIKVEDVSGRSLTLGEIVETNGLIVIFSCNTCPAVSQWEDRLVQISNIAKLNNIGMIALNPNERTRDRGESLEDMKKRAAKQSYNFYYALDKDHQIADAFGASRTPQVFVFNSTEQLVYIGAIDDNPRNATQVQEKYLEDAIQKMVAGQELIRTTTKLLGCPIKRVN
ncbi:redoxin domain-containing protein [Balneola vulgaris]|uniref:redoxin domain-containing protein n=1 Tax=Balneola vulgaris TaxID=287535 RepID=UPI00036D09FF|nr:redoxin domain-containing protein [Balneola vulgaris]